MVIRRGDIWWADLDDPAGSAPGYRRPVLVLQADHLNRSHIATVICAILTSQRHLAGIPGNLFLHAGETGLPKDSVANFSQIITIDKARLTERTGKLSGHLLLAVAEHIRLVLDLW